jgi:hypothetical protein
MTDNIAPHDEAYENLRIIRSLMERASIYRALSAPAALFGGVLAVATSAWGYRHSLGDVQSATAPREFLTVWLIILVLSGSLNLFLLFQDSQRRGQSFLSDGLRIAMRALAPPLLSGGMLGAGLICQGGQVVPAVLVWIICYGLALQATMSFAPKSLIRLARAFLISGQLLTAAWALTGGLGGGSSSTPTAWLLMGFTFGLCHIVYAAAVFATKQPH